MIPLLLIFFLASCSAPYYQQSAELAKSGDYEAAAEALKKADLPYQEHNEASLLLLSRGLLNFQREQYDLSARDFEKALDAIDYYQQFSAPEMAAQVLIQDTVGAYVPPPFEKSLARFYQALAFLHKSDEESAAATLSYLENHLPAEEQNPLVSYLLAQLLRRRGDVSNHQILLSRLKIKESSPSVIVIHHRGQAPLKFSQIAPVSQVSVALLEQLLSTQNIRPALSTLVGIPVPALKKPLIPKPAPLLLNHQLKIPTISYNVAEAAGSQLDQEMPLISARAAARLLIRRGLVASTKKHHSFVDAAMLFSNFFTQADTRSWALLPASIDLYALDLTPGEHVIHLGDHKTRIQVPLKKLVVLEIFQPNHENVSFSRGNCKTRFGSQI